MKKIVIIEDEALSARRLVKMLHDMDDTLQVDGPLRSVAEVVDYLRRHNDYTMIFSDIRLQDGDVFQAFRQQMPTAFVVFTTAYDEYAMQAIKAGGLDYLLKPIDDEELRQAIGRAESFAARLQEHRDRLRATADGIARYRERFLAYRQDELIPVSNHDILYFHKEERRVALMLHDGNVYSLPLTIQELKGQLNPDEFFRINRQYIIHVRGIRRISQFFNSKLKVRLHRCDDNDIVVSKERAALFKVWLDR